MVVYLYDTLFPIMELGIRLKTHLLEVVLSTFLVVYICCITFSNKDLFLKLIDIF